jgi:hypothetical protein
MRSGGLEYLYKQPLERVIPLFGHAGNRQRLRGVFLPKS